MEHPPEIVPASQEDLDDVSMILAEAFAEDPCLNWVVPATQLHPAYFRFLISQLYLKHDMVFIDSNRRSAAMWLPPGVSHVVPVGATLAWLVFRLMLLSGLSALMRTRQAQEVMDRNHPREPHYYLHALGARRGCKGMGLGSALLKHVTRRCDEELMPAYLENTSHRNLAFYERHGFEVREAIPVGKGGPTMFFMWREPRNSASEDTA